MGKNKVIALILLLIVSCSKVDQKRDDSEFPSRWVSDSNNKFEIWFQDWSDYTRLFMKVNEDTIRVYPNQYATVTKNKKYLFPKEYDQIKQKQLIGNIVWVDQPLWLDGYKNSFNWLIDRSNPKINLPVTYKCEALLIENKKLNLKVFDNEEIIFNIYLKPVKVY